jgi:nitrogen regulatory protein P-II 1
MLLSARDRVVGYVPKVRVDVILDDAHALKLVDEIREAKVSFKGKAMYWLSAVEESGEL